MDEAAHDAAIVAGAVKILQGMPNGGMFRTDAAKISNSEFRAYFQIWQHALEEAFPDRTAIIDWHYDHMDGEHEWVWGKLTILAVVDFELLEGIEVE